MAVEQALSRVLGRSFKANSKPVIVTEVTLNWGGKIKKKDINYDFWFGD